MCLWTSSSAAQPAALAVDAKRLTPDARAVFDQIVQEEVCPCDCPKTLGQCLAVGTSCGPAVALGEWLIDQLEQGADASIAESVAKEVTSFSSPAKAPVVNGYAGKGAAKPTVTIVEYADFQCGHCKAAVPVVEALLKQRKDIRVVYKHFPLSVHPMARGAAIAAEAAGRQGKFWEMHGAIFATQEDVSDAMLQGHAKALGLDMNRFNSDLKDPALAKLVDDSRAEANALGINGTPAFFINGRAFHLNRSVDGFQARLRMEAARASSSCK
jgi:protein-disulfide isomerase